MKIDELIALARSVASRYRMHAVIAGSLQDDANQLALGVLALLTPEKPCGWDASDVATDAGDGYVRVYAMRDLRADDEAPWAAVEVLRAVERAMERAK